MINPVLILTRNNLELTKKCVASVLAQDIPVTVMIFDNGSSDGTVKWAENELPKDSPIIRVPKNLGVSLGWNTSLQYLFVDEEADHVLTVGNDVELPPYFYSEILSYDEPFLTGRSAFSTEDIETRPARWPLDPHPEFNGFLMRKWVWKKIGPFDESLVSYCGDCDLHKRGWDLGIGMWKANIPFHHFGSSTMRLAPQEEKDALQQQANIDRQNFFKKYGVIPGQPDYDKLFLPELFGSKK